MAKEQGTHHEEEPPRLTLEFSGWYGTVKEFMEAPEEEWLARLLTAMGRSFAVFLLFMVSPQCIRNSFRVLPGFSEYMQCLLIAIVS